MAQKILCINDSKYYLKTPDLETDLENRAKKYFKDIFGENSYYFNKSKITTSAGGSGIPDGYVLAFSDDDESAELFIIEYELSTKSNLRSHVHDQVTTFMNALDNLDTRDKIIQTFYSEIKINKPASFKVIYDTISKQRYYFVIIIDSKNNMIEESFKHTEPKPIFLEFKIYKNGANEAHIFDSNFEVNFEKKQPDKKEALSNQSIEKTSKQLEKTKEKTDTIIEKPSKGIMKSIYDQVVELLKQHPKLTYSEIIEAISDLQDKARPQNYLWNVIDRFGDDKIAYSDDIPTRLSLISDKGRKDGTTQFKKIVEALKKKTLTYNELLDAVPEFKDDYKNPLNSLRHVIMRYGIEKGLIEYTNDRPVKLRLTKKQ